MDQSTPLANREGVTTSGALDMSNPKDVALVRRAINTARKPRWKVDDSKRAELVECLSVALTIAKEHADYDSMNNCVRTFVAMEAQNQADDHLEEKHARLDSGQATEGITFVIEKAGGHETPAAQSP